MRTRDRRHLARARHSLLLAGLLLAALLLLAAIYPAVRALGTSPDRVAVTDPEMAAFVTASLRESDRVWTGLLSGERRGWRPPTPVLFDGAITDPCGFGAAAAGPFYCPIEEELHVDLAFLRALGDAELARAYVVAHEVGHHVQTLTGVQARIRGAQAHAAPVAANALSVRKELQADCLAGVALHARHGGAEVEPALAAVEVVARKLSGASRGRAVPESWVHATAQQRARWLRRGLESGDPDRCDTFQLASL